VNEQQSGKESARLELVPFPGVVDADSDSHDRKTDPAPAEGLDDEPVHRSKEATGWAASGLAGALRRSRRVAES
jgi:hypothetical protein